MSDRLLVCGCLGRSPQVGAAPSAVVVVVKPTLKAPGQAGGYLAGHQRWRLWQRPAGYVRFVVTRLLQSSLVPSRWCRVYACSLPPFDESQGVSPSPSVPRRIRAFLILVKRRFVRFFLSRCWV